MLADQLDYIVGVDPHRDSHALAVVHVVSGAVVLESTVAASSDGYAQALQLFPHLGQMIAPRLLQSLKNRLGPRPARCQAGVLPRVRVARLMGHGLEQ